MPAKFSLQRTIVAPKERKHLAVLCNFVGPSIVGDQSVNTLGIFKLKNDGGKVHTYQATDRLYFPVNEWFFSGQCEVQLFDEDINSSFDDPLADTRVCLHFRRRR